jgi:teichuronic acid biosynthesis glycosyltransferase TuaH
MDIRPFAVVATYLEDLLGYWGRDVINVLYGTDDYVAGSELMGLSARHLRKQELRALGKADVVAAVSMQLADRWAGLGADPVLIPNGCWPIDHGERAVPPRALDLPRPVVGLVAQLSERIDIGVLEAVAEAGFSLLIVGPRNPQWEKQRFKELIGRSGVRYVGAVPAEMVPSYLAAIDVGLTPYRDTPFNRASFPLKTLEYLAAGLPVVSSDLPAARWLRADLIRADHSADRSQLLILARNKVEVVDAIRALVGSEDYTHNLADQSRSDGARADRCVAFAAQHSWSHRADTFAAAIGLVSLQERV